MTEEGVPLSSLTTLRAGGPARFVFRIRRIEDIPAALTFAGERSLPWYVLGQGSNVLAADEGYDGVVMKMEVGGLTVSSTSVVAKAGASWEEVVEAAVRAGLWGIENLAGIPGTMGAAPVQNIGAYGTELSKTLISVEVFDAERGETRSLSKEECKFGYRDSIFKHAPHLIITGATLELHADGAADLSYPDLEKAAAEGADVSTPGAVAEAVRRIRARKFPDLSVEGTAGSFFKNPFIDEATYIELAKRYPGLPGFPQGSRVKVPLAFILDRVLGLRGYSVGAARLFEAQPLVVVLSKEGSAHDVEALAEEVASRVFAATGISIEREVRTMGKRSENIT